MLKLTARVVTGYLAGNKIAMSDLPGLIRIVHLALAEAGQEPAAVEGVPAPPAVPVRKSVAPRHVVCLDCGKKMTMLRRHVALNHGLSPAEYRAKWGLPPDHPLVAPEYAEKRSALARKAGLGTKRRETMQEAAEPATPGQHSYPTNRWAKPREG